MLGVIGAFVTCMAMVAISLRAGLSRYNRRECRVMRQCLAGGAIELSGSSRPARLLEQVRSEHREPALIVNSLNETLTDVDFETRGGRDVFRACARVAATAGMAGACVEIALHTATVAIGEATVFALVAVAVGLTSAASCAVIGQWATQGAILRRQLWDDFVRWLLNSELSQTAWSVRVSGMQPTHDVENGQDT